MFQRREGEGEIHDRQTASPSRRSEGMFVIGSDHNEISGFQPDLFAVHQVDTAAGLNPEYFRKIMPVKGYVLP